MCRLFGFRSAIPSGAHRSLLEAENALSSQSTKHPDGWGIGWFVDDDAYIIKSATAAHACARFRKASSRLKSHTFVVHVRKATVGTLDHLNAHPFRFGRWLFAHNGTIFEFEKFRDWLMDRTDPTFLPLVLGDTDSETVFFFLLSRLKQHGIDPSGRQPSDASQIAGIVRQALLELDAEAKRLNVIRPILNVLLTDGRSFIAHRAGMPLFLSTQKKQCADFETCVAPSKVCLEPTRPNATAVNHFIVASEPIDADENIWEEIQDGCTLSMDGDFFVQDTAPPDHWIAPYLPDSFKSNPTPLEC